MVRLGWLGHVEMKEGQVPTNLTRNHVWSKKKRTTREEVDTECREGLKTNGSAVVNWKEKVKFRNRGRLDKVS